MLLKDGEIYSDQPITEIIKNNGSLRKMLVNYFEDVAGYES
ncbi:hypothetical protein [Spiroplasma poulsonii]|nr:hypothetical protein [Spiroplasma poulsonii]